MPCRGVHFALTDLERSRLLAHEDQDERLEHMKAELEERLFDEEPERVCETDKAWDAIHRALTDGSLHLGRSTNPGSNVILGGRSLYDGDDHIMVLKTPDQVREIASLLATITEDRLREGYQRIDADAYDGELDDEDFGATWQWFQELRTFYERAARDGHHVLFTVDQ